MQTPLTDNAVVVRGGIQRDASVLLEQVLDNLDMTGLPVLSVHALEPFSDESRTDTILRICEETPVKHGKVQVSSVGELRALDLEVVKDATGGQAATHCHVIFQENVRESDLQRFVAAMEGPTPRPKRLREEDGSND